MSRSDRISLIAAIAMRFAAPKVAAVSLPTRYDLADEASLVTGTDAGDCPNRDCATDDGAPIASSLPFDVIPRDKVDALLSPEEVRALRREGIDFRPVVWRASQVDDPEDIA